MKKKYYDGFNVVDILFKNLEPRKMWKVLNAFSECDGVDAEEVVRCTDCKHWACDDSETYCNELGIFGTDMNSYCSYAKRKEE